MANEVIKFFGKLLLLGVKTCPNSAFLAAPGDFCATFLSFLSKVVDISTAHIMVLKANTSFSSFVMVLRVHHISFRNGSRVHCQDINVSLGRASQTGLGKAISI